VSDLSSKAGGVQEFVEPLVSIYQYEQHEYGKLFPEIQEPERSKLRTNIKEQGLLNKITRQGDKILEGWHRYVLMREEGILQESNFIDFTGTDEEAKQYVIAQNILRRHLDADDRARIGAKLLAQIPKDKGGRPKLGEPKKTSLQMETGFSPALEADSRTEASPSSAKEEMKKMAAQMHVSTRRLQAAAKLEKHAEEVVGQDLQDEPVRKAADSMKVTAAAKATGQKSPRTPRKPKPKVMEFKDGHTLGQIFHEMFSRGLKTAEVRVVGQARAIVTLDADVKPIIGISESEIVALAAAQKPPISESDALAMLDRCRMKTLTYDDWGAALRTWRREEWLKSQKPSPQRASQPQRAPQGRKSAAEIVARADRAAADQERAMRASMNEEEGKWNRR
jgi:hypothetical protein